MPSKHKGGRADKRAGGPAAASGGGDGGGEAGTSHSAAATVAKGAPVANHSSAAGGGANSGGNSNSAGATVAKGGTPSSPTTNQLREQQALQQQVYQHQLQLLRLAQQQRPGFPVAEVGRTGFMFIGAVVALYLVFKDYGWAMTTALAAVLYTCGLFRFLSVLARWLFKTVDSVSYNDALRRADIMMEPIVKKVTHSGENATLNYGCSCMQGWRRTMEDAHTMLTFDDGGFFAVYDGHSGSATSKFCGTNMYDFVADTAAFRAKNYPTALYDGFIAIDRHLLAKHGTDRSGCTAVVLFVKGDELFCANAGDSRCVICRDGEPFPLSTDHKPYLPTEQARIERAGGYVWARRVNGILALSRAIGDFGFKQNTQVTWDQQAVTSAPEVRSTRLNRDRDEFAVIACDGIWDVMTNEQVIEFVRSRVQQRMPLGNICELLMDACLAPQPFGLGCDNMSVIIVQFKRPTKGVGAAVANVASPTSGNQVAPLAATPGPDQTGLPMDAATASADTVLPPTPPTQDITATSPSPTSEQTPDRGTAEVTGVAALEENAASIAESLMLEEMQGPTAQRRACGSPLVPTVLRMSDSPDILDFPPGEKDATTPVPGRGTVETLHSVEEVNYAGGRNRNGDGSPASGPLSQSSPAAGATAPALTGASSNSRDTSRSEGSTPGAGGTPTAASVPPTRGAAAAGATSEAKKYRSAPPARSASSVSELDQLKNAVHNGLQ